MIFLSNRRLQRSLRHDIVVKPLPRPTFWRVDKKSTPATRRSLSPSVETRRRKVDYFNAMNETQLGHQFRRLLQDRAMYVIVPERACRVRLSADHDSNGAFARAMPVARYSLVGRRAVSLNLIDRVMA